MRIAHFSDLHYATRTLGEVDRCFGHAIGQAITADVDAAIISGDATDHALELHAPAVDALACRLRELAEHCPVLLLQGTYSHEPPGTLEVFRLLSTRHPIHVARRITQVALTAEGRWLSSGDWRFDPIPNNARAVFSCLPAVNKAEVAAAVGATGAAEAVGEAIGALLGGWGVVNQRARAAGVPTIGVAHGTVSGCVTEHGVPMAGLDHEFTTTLLFRAEASAFMLGHIHKHQWWRDGSRLAAYAGSIGRLHYGEEGDKGFIIWTVDADGARLEFLATPARRMVHLDFGGVPDLAVIQTAAAGAQGAFVRVRWNVAEEERETIDRAAILTALTGAADVKLEARVIPVLRSRAAGISQAPSLEQKLRRWAEATGVDAAGLAARLGELANSEVDEIVRRVANDDGGRCPNCPEPSAQHDPPCEATAAPASVSPKVPVAQEVMNDS
ncbi:MAG: metallophosphoesterase family protein [Acidobacteriota bacterium]